MKTPFFVLPVLVVVLFLPSTSTAAEVVSVNVLSDVRPLFYIDEQGTPCGVYVDLIKAIGDVKGWSIHFECNSWGTGIEKVKQGTITLMPGVLKTKEREEFLDFHAIPVMVSWGQVAVRENSPITAIPDLEGKVIGIMKQDQNARNFKTLIDGFHINCSYVEVATHSELVPLIETGNVDAGVFYSAFQFSGTRVKSTSIFFNPGEGYFATVKGKNKHILESIDQELKRWKTDTHSPYYAILQKHMGSGGGNASVIPRWVFYAAGGGLSILLLSFLWNITLNRSVKRKTEELRNSEQRFYKSLKRSPTAIAITDQKGTILFLSDRFTEYFGYTCQDLMFVDNWFIRAYPDAATRSTLVAEWFKRIEEYYTTGSFRKIEASVTCRNGSSKTILFNFEAIDQLHITSFTDVTEQRLIEKALRESEENYRTVADYTYDWEFWQLPDKTIKYTSPSCKEITGYSVEEFMQNSTLVDSIVVPEDRLLLVNHLNNSSTRCELLEFRILTREGKVKWIGHSCQKIYDDKGTYRGIRVNNRDISEMKLIQEQLRQSQKMQAIGQLAGGIAHDFNNILGGIIGFADLSIDMVEKGSTLEHYLRQILNAGDRAKQLVRQILTFSRQSSEAKKVLLLKPMISEVLGLLEVSTPSSVRIDFKADSTTSPILADATNIHETLMNLTANAVFAMQEKGTLTVRLYEVNLYTPQNGRLGTILPGRYCVVEVSDTGCGMNEETMERIFEPFFTTKPTGKGTGMGLSVVYGICRTHEANIQVESTQGTGTTFKLYFPAVIDTSNSTHVDAHTGRRGNEHILFVDDEPVLTDMAHASLHSLGYTVTTCNDSREALELIRREPAKFQCLITDQTMPEMHGIDLARQAIVIAPNLPIILCTGYSNTVNETIAKEAGISRFLMKPLTGSDLSNALRDVLENSVQGTAES